MRLVILNFPENKIPYNAWCAWCERVGYDGIDPEYRNAEPTWYLTRTEVPEDLAILFKIEFGV